MVSENAEPVCSDTATTIVEVEVTIIDEAMVPVRSDWELFQIMPIV
jgi:hypothetical protein